MTEPLDPREADAFFLLDPAKLDDPFADLAWLREHRPVLHHPGLGQWFVFRHDDCTALFHDARLSADRMKGFVDAAPAEVRDELRGLTPFFEAWVLMRDGDAHDRLRRALHAGFDLRAVQGLREAIARSAGELLDRAPDRHRLDACADYAFLLPAYVLSDFLGVHRGDRERVVRWSVDFVDFFNVVPINADTTARMARGAREMMAYTRALIAERRSEPKPDFLGGLVAADELGEDEIVANVMLLLLAGHVAVRNLIGNLLWLLLTRPERMARLRAEPALIRGAIEETLRFEPPVTMIPRIALAAVEVRGATIPAGALVQLCLAAANRDPEHVADPDRFDIGRKPTRHLSFAVGPHACLGALLAREQAQIAVEALLARAPDLRLDPDRPIAWYRNAGNRGPVNLPVLLR